MEAIGDSHRRSGTAHLVRRQLHLALQLPSRLADQRWKGKPVLVHILFQVGKGDKKELVQVRLGSVKGREYAVRDLVKQGLLLLCRLELLDRVKVLEDALDRMRPWWGSTMSALDYLLDV